jgi:predicted Fe-Mo cluster-binding NifX family protein
MKIIIPVFEDRISPRFDCAPGFRLYEMDGDNITVIREISCDGWNDTDRVSRLTGLGIDTLICGGIPDYLLGMLTNNGIKVIPWVAGDTSEVLTVFLQGRLNAGTVICPGRKSRRCKGGIKVRN